MHERESDIERRTASEGFERSRKLILDCFCSIWQVHYWASSNNGREKMLHAFSCQYLINVQSQKAARKLFSSIVCCFSHWIPNNWFYNPHFSPLFIRIDECVRGFYILYTQCAIGWWLCWSDNSFCGYWPLVVASDLGTWLLDLSPNLIK